MNYITNNYLYLSPNKYHNRNFKSDLITQSKSTSLDTTSNKKSQNTNISQGAKIVLCIGFMTTLAIGADFVFCKGRHIKSLLEKCGIKGNKKQISNTKGKGNSNKSDISLPVIEDFKNIEEATTFFEKNEIRTFFNNDAKNHIQDLNSIKNEIPILEKNGVAISRPDSIVIEDWSNIEELKRIVNTLNISESKATNMNDVSSWAWGTVAKSNDNKMHLFINSKRGEYKKFIHEMGHIHQDFIESSYWHSKGLKNEDFIKKQMEVLGLSNIELSKAYIDNIKQNNNSAIPSILGLRHLNVMNNEQKKRVGNLFTNIVQDSDYDKLFFIMGKNGENYWINAKKIIDKMGTESGVYAPDKLHENVAEMFEKLNNGKEFSDLVMLMYDISGGGRIPNLVIKGQKYDDYIKSLYDNNDLIRQLRECIEVKQL